jgi:hypothetical protein
MFSPTTLLFSVFVLVIGDRPLRTGSWFYLGAFTATLAIGVIAGLVIGDAAASSDPSSPKTWVAVVDIVVALLLLVYVVRALRRPVDPKKAADMMDRMGKVAASPWIAVIGAGAALANPGAFIPIALKDISETDPSATQFIVEWLFFTLASLLPLAIALVLLLVARDWTKRLLGSVRDWLELHARTIAAVIVILLAVSLLRNGISGLTS